ncbi:MAG: FKBP-type peptidyl-prolyl cis-trans isomerase [Xanthomonadales bacterium]
MKSVWTPLLLVTLLAWGFAAAPAAIADEGFRSAAGGVRFKDLQTGQGPEAETGMVATIHFTGWLDERGVRGREVFDSRRRGEPVSFVIGDDGVMQGWNVGVLGMKPGGKRMLLVPPGMAWAGREPKGVVPPDAAMMFRIELLDLERAGTAPD